MSSYLYFLLCHCQGYGRVIGVSKRCCPTCRTLLYLLAKDEEQPFLVKGTHSTVTACTLPPWLPSDVVDRMNQIFGGQLREELIKIFKSPLTRSRSLSTGSRRISSDDGHRVTVGGPIIQNDSGFDALRMVLSDKHNEDSDNNPSKAATKANQKIPRKTSKFRLRMSKDSLPSASP